MTVTSSLLLIPSCVSVKDQETNYDTLEALHQIKSSRRYWEES